MPGVRQRWCCLDLFSRPQNLYLPAYLYIYIIFGPVPFPFPLFLFPVIQAASDCLAQSAKLAKKLDDPFKSVFDALAYANDVVNGKLDVSKKENEFIYHDKVPDLDALQEIKVEVET